MQQVAAQHRDRVGDDVRLSAGARGWRALGDDGGHDSVPFVSTRPVRAKNTSSRSGVWMLRSSTSRLAASRRSSTCLLYTSDAADDLLCVDLGGRRIIKK